MIESSTGRFVGSRLGKRDAGWGLAGLSAGFRMEAYYVGSTIGVNSSFICVVTI